MINSNQWLDHILKILFEPEEHRLDKVVETLTERNAQIKQGGLIAHGFMHMGQIYIPEVNLPMHRMLRGVNRQQLVPPLAFELLNEVSEFAADRRKVDFDKTMIKQILFKLIVNSTNEEELRSSLPDCVANLIPQLKDVPRKFNDPTIFIRSDWRAVEEFNRLLPKIEFYAMTRLIY